MGCSMSKFYWFGDSWVVGDELENQVDQLHRQQFVYAQLVSDYYRKPCVNLGVSGSSPTSLVYAFNQVAPKLTPQDTVFFGLSAYHRMAVFDENGALRQAIPGSNHNAARFEHTDVWFKFFDNHYQRLYNYDSTINLLYLWAKSLSVTVYFYNIFSTVNDQMLEDLVDTESWLIPKNQCLADFIMHLDGNIHGYVITDDCAEITTTDWQHQQKMLEQYVRPNHAHPNIAGQRKIAQEIIKILDHDNKK
jgi:hypothetical protein